MGDGLVARDRSRIQEIANSISTKLTVRTLVGPGPEQTAALGGRPFWQPASFRHAKRTVPASGFPPSYDQTDVLTGGLARIRAQEMLEAGENDIVAARLLAVQPADEDEVAVENAEDDTDSPPRKPLIPILIGVVLIVVLLLVFLL